MNRTDLWRRLLAEWLGSALLAAVVIGSGVAAQRLSPGQTGLELFENAAAIYLPAQVVGCICGAVLANLMFSLSAVSISTHDRASGAHFLSETVATAGLILVIFCLLRTRRQAVIPAAVAAYIGAAYFFTSSTSFANPAITVGRMFSNTFAGIAPSSAPSFIAAQILGGTVAFALIRVLYPKTAAEPTDQNEPMAAQTAEEVV
jgi:arsenate reductase